MRLSASIFLVLPVLAWTAEPSNESDGITEPYVATLGSKYTLAAGLVRQAVTAYREGDYVEFRDTMVMVKGCRWDHPTYTYYLAAAHALNGDAARAAAAIQTLADWGVHLPVTGESDFDAVRDDPAFAAAVAAMEQNLQPRGAAPLAFSVPANGGLWEGVAFDPDTGRTFLSDLHRGEIWVRSAKGKLARFTAIADEGFGAGGLAVDPDRGLLWVSSPAMPEVAGWTDALAGQSHLVALDLGDGGVRAAYPLDDGDNATPQTVVDVTVAPDGTVYAADSTTPVIWRVRPGDETATVFTTITFPGERHSLQSIAPTADGRWLFVSDYSTGIHRVDTTTGETVWQPVGRNTCLVGIDGFARSGDVFLAAQNGVSPPRLLRFTLAPADDSDAPPWLSPPTVIAAGLPDLADPTLVSPTPDGFLVIGDAGWKHFGARAAPDPDDRTVPILKIVNAP